MCNVPLTAPITEPIPEPITKPLPEPLPAMLPVLHKVEFAVVISNDADTGLTTLPRVNYAEIVRQALCAAVPSGVLVGAVSCRKGFLDDTGKASHD